MYETIYEDDDYKVEQIRDEYRSSGPVVRYWVKKEGQLKDPTPHEFRQMIHRMAKMATEYRLIKGLIT